MTMYMNVIIETAPIIKEVAHAIKVNYKPPPMIFSKIMHISEQKDMKYNITLSLATILK